MTRKWNIVNDNSTADYDVANEITYNTEVLKSNLCGYNDPYILVRGNNTIMGYQAAQVAFRNCAPFTKCITKIDGITIDHAEDLDLVMPMYNLIEYSSNYSETTGSLWFYSKDEATNFHADIANTSNIVIIFTNNTKYKAKLLENTKADGDNGILKNAAIPVSLKHLSNFWRSLKVPLINCKIELKLEWANYCAFSAAGDNNTNDIDDNINFTMKDTKLYVPVVNFYVKPIDSDIKQYKEIRKLTTGRGEDCTTECLLDYNYIKSHYKLIAVDLSRQKELDADPNTIQQIVGWTIKK